MDALIHALPFDPGALRGLSEKLLTSHHQNNDGGAVRQLNAIHAQLAPLPFSTATGFQLNGLKREEMIATNSMVLHELYFACLGGDGKTMEPAMALALAANFGTVERLCEEFVAMGMAQGGGSGWVLLMFQPREGSRPECTLPARWNRLLAGCRPAAQPTRSRTMKWVTPERPTIDRIFVPRLIQRFIDRGTAFLYVSVPDVLRVARRVRQSRDCD